MSNAGSNRRPNVRSRAAVQDILIAHDEEVARIGVREILRSRPGLRVCGEASTTAETLKNVEELRPHLLLLRLGLPDRGGLAIIPELLNLRSDLRILILAAEGPKRDIELTVLTPATAQRALNEGALGVVLKPDAQDILLAVDSLIKNKSYVSATIFDVVSSALTQRIEHLPGIGDLTGREVEILGHIAAGKASKVIAADLNISPRTVEAHRANVMHKLGFHSQADLILFGLRHQTGAESRPSAVRSDM